MTSQSDAGLTLMTSIPPAADERLASVIPASLRSFEKNGLSAISINWPGEIERVRALYPTVAAAAVSAERPAIFPNRYGPPLGALFAFGRNGDALGICNADVLMLQSDIRARVFHQPERFFVAHRLDVDRLGGDIVGVYRRGVDAVFFNRGRYPALLEDEHLARFQLGAPFWDILMPVIASFHGPVSFIEPPFIVHAVHEARWSDDDYANLRQLAIATAVRHAQRHAAGRPHARAFLELFDRYVGRDVESLNRRARRNAMTIFNLWLAKLEHQGAERLHVEISGELSLSAFSTLGGPLADTPTDADTAGAGAGAFGVQRMRQWTKAHLRVWKRRRRERAIATRLADVEF